MQKLTELKGVEDVTVSQISVVATCIDLIYDSEIIIHNGKFYTISNKE